LGIEDRWWLDGLQLKPAAPAWLPEAQNNVHPCRQALVASTALAFFSIMDCWTRQRCLAEALPKVCTWLNRETVEELDPLEAGPLQRLLKCDGLRKKLVVVPTAGNSR